MTSCTKFWKDVFNVIFPIYCILYVDTEKFGIGHKRYLFVQVSKLQEGFGLIYCCKLHKMSFIKVYRKKICIAQFIKKI